MTKLKTFILIVLSVVFLGFLIDFYSSSEPKIDKLNRITIDPSWYPLRLYDKEQQITVFSEELTEAIAAKEKLAIELLGASSRSLFNDLENGTCDAILSTLLILEDEGKGINYLSSNPYYLLGPVLVVSTSSNITSINDLNGKSIGLIIGNKPIISLYKNKEINFVFYDYNDLSKLIEDVSNDVVNGMILNMIPAYELTHSDFYQTRLKIASEPLTKEGLRLIAKNTPESKKLIDAFNEGLKNLKKDGTYSRILSKWGLFYPDES
jgi:polar amino acid transport system substrate-binding protein